MGVVEVGEVVEVVDDRRGGGAGFLNVCDLIMCLVSLASSGDLLFTICKADRRRLLVLKSSWILILFVVQVVDQR